MVSKVWFAGHQYIASNDTRLPINLNGDHEYFFYLWSHSTAPGNFDSIKITYLMPVGIILDVFNDLSIKVDVSTYEKILITSLLLLSGYSFYYLMCVLLPTSNNAIKIAGAIFYSFNFFSLYLWISLTFILFRYASFPLLLALYIKYIHSSNGNILKKAVIFSLVYTFLITPAYGTVPFIITDFLFLFSYFIFFIITNYENKTAIKRALIFSLYASLIWVGINSFFIIPVISGFLNEIRKISNTNVAAYQDSYSLYLLNSARIVDSVRLMGFWAFDGKSNDVPYYHWYSLYKSTVFVLASFMIPVFAIFSFFSKKDRRNVIFFSIMIITFIFFVKGGHDPFGYINKVIFSNFNLDSIFRSAYQRFVGYIALSLAVLFTIGLNNVIKIKHEK